MWRGRLIKNKILDTNVLWIIITIVLIIPAWAFHNLATHFDLYENPPHPDLRIDVYTHSVSAILFPPLRHRFVSSVTYST